MNKDNILKNAMVLFAITLIAGLLLGLTYSATKEPIAEQQIIKRNQALNNVLSDATFVVDESADTSSYEKITDVYIAENNNETVGYCFQLATKEGYGGVIELVVGISLEGKITGIDIIKHAETPGLGALADGDKFKGQYVEKPATNLNVVKGGADQESEIDAIGGATITSVAVTNAVNEAIGYFNDHLAKGAQ